MNNRASAGDSPLFTHSLTCQTDRESRENGERQTVDNVCPVPAACGGNSVLTVLEGY